MKLIAFDWLMILPAMLMIRLEKEEKMLWLFGGIEMFWEKALFCRKRTFVRKKYFFGKEPWEKILFSEKNHFLGKKTIF